MRKVVDGELCYEDWSGVSLFSDCCQVVIEVLFSGKHRVKVGSTKNNFVVKDCERRNQVREASGLAEDEGVEA